MHPAFRSGKGMILAGLLWSPVTILTIILHKTLSGSEFTGSVILIIPPMTIMFGIAISVWYICKGLPFERGRVMDFFLRHSLSLVLILAVWLGITTGYSRLLDIYFPTGDWNILFTSFLPLFAGTGLFVYLLSTLIYYLIFANEKIRVAEKEMLQRQLEASRSELETLKTTIHPHFLFNSLNLMSPLIKKTPALASELVSHLSDFLIYSFEYSVKQSSTVPDEIEHIKNYLSIEKFRLGERLMVEYDIGKGTSELRIPPLILLPVIENSIKHGISQILAGGTISIKAGIKDNFLIFSINNPFEEPVKKLSGKGHGLNNLKKRLKIYYGGDGGILTESKENIFTVKIFIPVAGRDKIE